MEKKQYIKPSAKAYQITPAEILVGSGSSQESFSFGGIGTPSGGRAKLFDFEVSDGDSDE